ncbi:MAG: hypothetical protein LQ339_007571 [Xanthoria mediterranea]|nr:MAG: hypothetical protein LQ339_007571 [Xanthoria mediterranea]
MLLSSLTPANRQDQDRVDPVVAISLSVLAIRQIDLRGGKPSSPVHEPVPIDVEAYQRSENGDGVNIGHDLTKHTKTPSSAGFFAYGSVRAPVREDLNLVEVGTE